MASGSWNGCPGASSADTPVAGSTTDQGAFEAFSFPAMKRPNARFSSAVVRISVTCALCLWNFRPLNFPGTVSSGPKFTMSSAPTDTTYGTPARTIASIRPGPPGITPPTISSATSVVVASITPAMLPEATSRSMIFPPVPVAWNTIGSHPACSTIRLAPVTQGVVTPNMVIAATGRSATAPASAGASAMPAMAAAARLRMGLSTRLSPATSTRLGTRIRSVAPT